MKPGHRTCTDRGSVRPAPGKQHSRKVRRFTTRESYSETVHPAPDETRGGIFLSIKEGVPPSRFSPGVTDP
ncbi:MAG: hypothetical protein B5M55_03540 [Desulfococcus sp. 4484_242]|nr:MAG: hypothetical protein B5M55_03540 [Desulfococcus sp. 4484_242]